VCRLGRTDAKKLSFSRNGVVSVSNCRSVKLYSFFARGLPPPRAHLQAPRTPPPSSRAVRRTSTMLLCVSR
jgi:hypothetical protein